MNSFRIEANVKNNIKYQEMKSILEQLSSITVVVADTGDLDAIKKFKPRKAIITNLSPVLDYKVLKKIIPINVIPAHDGLTINL